MRFPTAVVVLCACGSSPPAAVTPDIADHKPVEVKPATPPPAPTPPELRLPTTVLPTRNAVELVLDPKSEDFTGTITTDLEVGAPTSVLWLNAKEITIHDARFIVKGEAIPAKPIEGGKEFVGLVPAHPLAVGQALLVIKYAGKAHRNDGDGIYTVEETGNFYAFTQFESTDARQAFPTFDEPSFKVPWQLTIHTKKELVALSNTPVEGETDEPNGMKAVKFAETKPLPSYLVAFAVGPFEAVDAGKTRNGAPIRIVVPRGRTADAAYPAQVTKPILDGLEDYFGTPYPYPKLDMLACAVFNAGAMENPGLITWRQEYILTKPAELTLAKQKNYAAVAAHEIAHQWFGDYVTLAWWDDTWLNESFASWAESKVIEKWKPEWEVPVELVHAKNAAMGADSLDAARAIRQPIKTHGDILNAFDGITYAKGEAVLTMIERYVGAETFQAGVRAYLAKHAWKNATYEDFVSAMSTAANKDMHPVFDTFVLQSGLPLVSIELACDKGGTPKLVLEQRRYVPTGSKIDPKRTWQLPICVRWGAGATSGRDCTLLSTPAGELPLTAKTCPDWVLPNEAELGYYRPLPKGDLLDKLLAKAPKALTLSERVGLLGDVNALVASGDAQNSMALNLVETLSKDKSHHIVDASVGVIAGIDEMVPDNLRANYERVIKKLYRGRALELGWQSKKGEDDNTKQLRPTLLSLVAGTGRDPELIKQATDLTQKWLVDHKAIEPELVGVALRVAARFGDQKLFDRFHEEAKKATDRQERAKFLGAMGAFIDPKIIKQAMAITLTDEFELREALGMLRGGFEERQTREQAYTFMRDNFEAISNKLPAPYRPYMAFTFVAMCDDARKAEFDSFFRPRIEKLDGGPRVMEQALEQLTLCSARKKAQTPGVITFLKRQ